MPLIPDDRVKEPSARGYAPFMGPNTGATMAYTFGVDESVRPAILRCAREQLERAVLELNQRSATDPVGAIHNARKAIKKERSLLRLARSGMSREQREQENAILRDAARCLAAVRDADAMIASIGKLSERFARAASRCRPLRRSGRISTPAPSAYMGVYRPRTRVRFRRSPRQAAGWTFGSCASAGGRRWRAGSYAPTGAGVGHRRVSASVARWMLFTPGAGA